MADGTRAREVDAVPLPPGAEPPLRVFRNGEELREGADFEVRDGALRFVRPLRARPALGAGRTLLLALGIGVYGDLRGDQLDIGYHVGGSPRLATAVPLTPGPAAEPPPG